MDGPHEDQQEENRSNPDDPMSLGAGAFNPNQGDTAKDEHKNENERKDKTDGPVAKYFKGLRCESPGRHIELVLAGAITLSAIGQWITSCNNNEKTGNQTSQLISAAKINACAAERNAIAAESFSISAGKINDGLGRAIVQLSNQAGYSRDMASTASKQLTVSQRPWVGIDSIQPGGLTRDSATGRFSEVVVFTLKNYGTSVAQNVRFFPSLVAVSPDPAVNATLTGCSDKPITEYYPGITIFPGNAPPATFNQVLTLEKKDMEKFIKRQRPGWGRSIVLAIGGCIDYRDGFTATRHHTGFYYMLLANKLITPETPSVPASILKAFPDILDTGPIN